VRERERECENSFTLNCPRLEETLTILGEVDSWSRGRRASVTLSAPKKFISTHSSANS